MAYSLKRQHWGVVSIPTHIVPRVILRTKQTNTEVSSPITKHVVTKAVFPAWDKTRSSEPESRL